MDRWPSTQVSGSSPGVAAASQSGAAGHLCSQCHPAPRRCAGFYESITCTPERGPGEGDEDPPPWLHAGGRSRRPPGWLVRRTSPLLPPGTAWHACRCGPASCCCRDSVVYPLRARAGTYQAWLDITTRLANGTEWSSRVCEIGTVDLQAGLWTWCALGSRAEGRPGPSWHAPCREWVQVPVLWARRAAGCPTCFYICRRSAAACAQGRRRGQVPNRPAAQQAVPGQQHAVSAWGSAAWHACCVWHASCSRQGRERRSGRGSQRGRHWWGTSCGMAAPCQGGR